MSGGQPAAQRASSQSVARRLPLPETIDAGADNARMKALFKSKPKTPADLVRQTRDLLIFVDHGGPDTKESKRDEKMAELSKLIRDLKQVLYGDSESEPVAEACAQLTQEFFRENTLRLLIICLPKLNLETFFCCSVFFKMIIEKIIVYCCRPAKMLRRAFASIAGERRLGYLCETGATDFVPRCGSTSRCASRVAVRREYQDTVRRADTAKLPLRSPAFLRRRMTGKLVACCLTSGIKPSNRYLLRVNVRLRAGLRRTVLSKSGAIDVGLCACHILAVQISYPFIAPVYLPLLCLFPSHILALVAFSNHFRLVPYHTRSLCSKQARRCVITRSCLNFYNYITRRQAVKLLGDILLDRSNSAVMTRYVCSRDNLRILMNLLRESSKSIQIEAFHVFKLFAANQHKPPDIVGILVTNRSKLLRLFADFKTDKEDEQFEADKAQVVKEIAALEPKERP
ncbi:UNVERIFIED_CONTAM: putative MO25-like protein [Sesamum calycinum]|uniref:MO25-like protein n=1 Tax=Sesamum calycinum TaxID=2727403 RepID=A0AAW2Q5X0_9LAMI